MHGNPYIHKVVPYDPVMDNFIWSEGQGTYEGLFNFVLMPKVNTDKVPNFIHGNEHKIEYDLNYA